ncbi:hypothetical protein EDD16DRAFT_1514909 [Pisolithus croceorrhizus]|nr:hypothetical protein EV401DRAFT_1885251 [Pisolithus croceorrhizus]KAI6132206.1 hypothetical protein EDD16DRAFT_1514909 [Pisolithus croceorrhizus]KAI6160050.1 hypothetical protein EDD17DRAFT_1510783 [Pisolithus thermaeus]
MTDGEESPALKKGQRPVLSAVLVAYADRVDYVAVSFDNSAAGHSATTLAAEDVRLDRLTLARGRTKPSSTFARRLDCAASLPPLHTLILVHRKGNKSALIARLQEYEESKVAPSPQSPSPPSRNVPGASRKASSLAAPTSDPVTPAFPQGGSPARTPPSASAEFFAFKILDLFQSTPSSLAQVVNHSWLYLPDFWDSTGSNSTFTEPDPEPPKLHVVGGTVIHRGSEPTLHLEKHSKLGTVQPAATVTGDVIVIKSGYLQEIRLLGFGQIPLMPPKLQVVGSAIINRHGGPTNHLEKHSDVGMIQPAAAVADDVIVNKSGYL